MSAEARVRALELAVEWAGDRARKGGHPGVALVTDVANDFYNWIKDGKVLPYE